MAKLPPLPTGVAPGSGYWNDWYEKMRTIVNTPISTVSWTIVTDKPTTLSGYNITDAQPISQRNAVNGYAGLNGASRITKGVDTIDDVIIDLSTKGLVLKDTQTTPHYWRVTIDNSGVLTTTDLGTTKP